MYVAGIDPDYATPGWLVFKHAKTVEIV